MERREESGSIFSCEGGYPDDVMAYYTNNGLATGGDPQATVAEPTGCLPYPSLMADSASCPTACDDGSALDTQKAGEYRTITSKNVDEIMQELYIYGSVVVCFDVYEDFYYLGPGIYQYSYGPNVGSHAVRVIGWGVENGVPYWLAVNQWGTGFGDNGFFKFLKGADHCGFESLVSFAYPSDAY
uniref:Peptidase C1A papain C-terminal domain-containing protein n=1 Tax=Romanomermis culicivorax TaxID=13658 RepID=A0A915I3S9_ROMCU